MAFLIEGYWYQADAHKLGVKITDAQVNKAFAKARKAEFPTAVDFTNYLKRAVTPSRMSSSRFASTWSTRSCSSAMRSP